MEGKPKGQDWKPIQQFIKEDVGESLHELIRGNVLTATRYFQHKVKNFINKVVMGKNNPMNVKYYTYKVEFQDRGAGHIHGTLWLKLDELELLQRGEDGKLKARNKEVRSSAQNDQSYQSCPMEGLAGAFTKLRRNEKLKAEDIP